MTTKKVLLPRRIGDLMLQLVKHLENYNLGDDHTAKTLEENFGARLDIDEKYLHATIPVDTFEKLPEVKLIMAMLLLITSKDVMHILNALPALVTPDERRKSAEVFASLLGAGDDHEH